MCRGRCKLVAGMRHKPLLKEMNTQSILDGGASGFRGRGEGQIGAQQGRIMITIKIGNGGIGGGNGVCRPAGAFDQGGDAAPPYRGGGVEIRREISPVSDGSITVNHGKSR